MFSYCFNCRRSTHHTFNIQRDCYICSTCGNTKDFVGARGGKLAKRYTITIEIEGGCLIDVSGLPFGWDYELIDHDIEDEDEIYN